MNDNKDNARSRLEPVEAVSTTPETSREIVDRLWSENSGSNDLMCRQGFYRAFNAVIFQLAKVSTPPSIGTFWTHNNGNVYEVLMLTNEASDREEYQPQVVYRGRNGNVWSRPLSDWGRSFKEVKGEL
jgi:hypothetical protein